MTSCEKILLTIAVGAVVLLTQSCETTKPPPGEKVEKYAGLPKRSEDYGFGHAPAKTSLDEDSIKNPDYSDGQKLKETLISNVQGSGASKEKPLQYFEKYLKPEDDTPQPFTLNTDAMPITDIVTIFASELNFNYILDPRVKGTVTISVNSKMTKRDLCGLSNRCSGPATPTPRPRMTSSESSRSSL